LVSRARRAKEVRRLEVRLAEQKRLKRKLLDSMLDGKISDATYKDAEGEFRVEIAATEKALRDLDARQLTGRVLAVRQVAYGGYSGSMAACDGGAKAQGSKFVV
jgi:hypothetical protein